MAVDKSVDLLNLLRGGANGSPGLRIVTVNTAAPYATTFMFEGTQLALDIDVFEVAASCYPLLTGDKLLAYPLVNAGGQRWALITKLNDCGVYMGTMQSSTSVLLDWAGEAVEAKAPPYVVVSNAAADGKLTSDDVRPLQAGDRVAVSTYWDGGVKYVILNKY